MKATKELLSRKLYGDLDGVSMTTASEAVDKLFGIVTNELKNGREVVVKDFGAFTPTECQIGRRTDPITGKALKRKKGIRVRFRPFTALKRSLNEK